MVLTASLSVSIMRSDKEMVPNRSEAPESKRGIRFKKVLCNPELAVVDAAPLRTLHPLLAGSNIRLGSRINRCTVFGCYERPLSKQ